MNLHIVSDIHYEFAPFELPDTGADLVIIPGDIGVGTKGFEEIGKQVNGRRILCLAGNHEYYRQDLPGLNDRLREVADSFGMAFLENETLILDDVRFICCTLWTDFALFSPMVRDASMLYAEMGMADYQAIRRGDKQKLRAADTLKVHEESRKYLEAELAESFAGKTVVVTHHAPSVQSLQAKFREDPLSPAFASALETMVRSHHIDLWVHGHTHFCCDYKIGKTRIVSNQRGYPGEEVGRFRPDFVIEV